MNECNSALPSKNEDAPQSLEKTVEAGTLVPRERVQQRTAEQVEDAPQSHEETVEAVTLVPCERVQQRTAARPADKARPSGIAKKSAKTKSDIAVSSDKARPPGTKKTAMSQWVNLGHMTWTVPPSQQP